MGTATELTGSRVWRTEGRDLEVVERHFLVEDELPWEAHANAVPTLPKRGDPLPSGGSMRPGRGDRGNVLLQVRDIMANYAGPGHPRDVLVVIVYRTGPDWRIAGIRRQVVWSSETSTSSKTVFNDLDGNIVTQGLSKPNPLTTIRARLEHAPYIPALNNAVGKTNATWFRLWPPGKVIFVGAQGVPVVGNDPWLGGSTVEYEFQANPDGWDEIRPQRDAAGKIVLDADGAVSMTTHRIVEQVDFQPLFPPTADPGRHTWFDPALPIIP